MATPPVQKLNGKKQAEARLSEFSGLSAEIVDLFYTQTFLPGSITTPEQVCDAFSRILGRRWKLCSISIFLRNESGALEYGASHFTEKLDSGALTRVAAFISDEVARTGQEVQVWSNGREKQPASADSILKGSGLKGSVGVPIFAGETLAGVLVVLSSHPDRIESALDAIRFIAAPVVIAVGNARRARDMQLQRERIESLVEELRQHGQALEEANRELRRVAQYRSMFLARMSHELRTPLTSVLGFAEILLDHEKLTDTQRRFCEKIQASGFQLQVSLNHLVDLSRLEAGQSELFLHEFSIREALKESCTAVARLAEKRNVSVNCELPELRSVVSDEGKLRQVLYNFLAHAISRSAEGGTVTVLGVALPNKFGIVISDDGPYVENFAKLFEPVDINSPVETSANAMNELGLVIARRLIDVLDGEVRLESNPPSGLTVHLEFPTRPSP